MSDTYNFEVGKMYDTVFFITMSLFEDSMIKRIFSEYDDPDQLENGLAYYKEMKKDCPQIPAILAPFCYTDYEIELKSFLIAYFIKSINLAIESYDGFINIFLDTENCRIAFIKWYFPDLSDDEYDVMYDSSDALCISDIISHSKINIEHRINFFTLLLNYDKISNILLDTLKYVFVYAHRLHLKHQETIKGIVNNTKGESVSENLESYFAQNVPKNHIYIFPILNPYVMFFKGDKNIYLFMIGRSFLETISYESDYNHVTTQSFAKMVASDSRYDIYKMFSKYTKLSVSDISSCLNLSKSTVYTHIENMIREKIIKFSQNINCKFYFTININYMMNYMTNVSEEYKKIEKLILKGKDVLYEPQSRKRRSDYQE